MAKKTRNTLKGFFETGDIPTQNQYQDLIDSYVSLVDTEQDPQIINTNFSSSGYFSTETNITASGNIFASGSISGSSLRISGDAEVENDLTVRGDIKIAQASKIECITNSSTHIQLQNDDTWLFDANGVEILQLTNASTPALVVNEGSADVDFRVESNGDTRAIFVDGGNNRIQIGSSTSTKLAVGTSTFGNSLVTINGDVTATHITASGNISASGTIFADNFQSTGGDVNGISFTDDLNLTGNLTASGAISATSITASSINATSINTSALTIAGAIFGQSTDTFWASGSSGEIYYNGGDVGIGTTTPGEKLHVIGNVSASTFKGSTFKGNFLDIDNTIQGGGRFRNIPGDFQFTIEDTFGNNGYIFENLDGLGNNGAVLTINGQLKATTIVTASQLISSGHITASGNISASGKITGLTGSFGRLEGLSPITIGSPVVFSTAVTMSSQISSSGTGSFGELHVDRYIRHKGDNDTHIEFLDNKLQLHAGNLPFITLDKDASTPFPLTINNGGNRINFRVQDKDSNLLLKTDSEAFKVNLYHAGNQKLETAAGGINVTGNITASGNISAGSITATSINTINITSSIVTASIIQTSGSNIFGDTITDTHTFNGHITASGNINASGNLLIDRINAAGQITASNTVYIKASNSGVSPGLRTGTLIVEKGSAPSIQILSANSQTQAIEFGDPEDSNVGRITYNHPNDDMKFFTAGIQRMTISGDGHITASKNISASGEGYFAKAAIGTNSPVDNVLLVKSTGGGTIPFGVAADDGSYLAYVRQNPGGWGEFHVTNQSGVTRVKLEGTRGEISASGDISSSGKITGLTGSFGRLEGLSPITMGSPMIFTSPITASGEISASNNIIADKVGIGTTSPSEKLSVANGNIQIEVAAAQAHGLIFNENGTQTMGIKYQGGVNGNPIDIFKYQGDITIARFMEDGKVGVGTTTPTSQLHVSGNIQVTGPNGHITASGNLKIDGSQVDFTNLPTSDPGVAGRLYNDSGTIKISL
jgi:cytoskeletal protein CcmA (bactofilin family)